MPPPPTSAIDSFLHGSRTESAISNGGSSTISARRNARRRMKAISLKSFSASLPRMVKRDFPYHQSRNKFRVKMCNKEDGVNRLILRNWFHSFLRWPIYWSLPLLLAFWTLFILIFAGLYMAVENNNGSNEKCLLGSTDQKLQWATAFALSLETCTTVGYGLPGSTNAFFEPNCAAVQIVIYAQMMWSMMFNAFIFAFFFVACSKSESRGAKVVFSDKMVIQTDQKDKNIYAKVQCFDLDSEHPIVESHVRIYAYTKRHQFEPLRIHAPNDDTGAFLVASLPYQITHHIGHHSVLSPKRNMPFVADSHGLHLRSADSAVCSREEIICPVCGESYGTYDRLQRHVEYNQMLEEREDYPPETSHRSLKIPRIKPVTTEQVQQHFASNISEIIVIIEAIDPQLSGTFQALQSYKFDDIIWEGEFEPCMKIENQNFTVDMRKFQEVRIPDAYKKLNELVDEDDGDFFGRPPMDIITENSGKENGQSSKKVEDPSALSEGGV